METTRDQDAIANALARAQAKLVPGGSSVVAKTGDHAIPQLEPDRIALLSRRPAEVVEFFSNPLPRPRDPVESREDPRFLELRHELLSRLLRTP